MLIMFPMGGIGKRFLDAGYTTPKPLLPLGDKVLLQWALESVKRLSASFHYIVTPDIIKASGIAPMLPQGCWHILLASTKGPLFTVLEAEGCLQGEEELLICDCDSTMDSRELSDAIEVFRSSGAKGGVTVRKTSDPMCSFAEIDSAWWVSQTREKDPFTSWSTTGPYWFKSAKQFVEAARKAMAAHHVSISPVYNYLPGRTKAVPVSSFRHFGTPEAYEAVKQELGLMSVIGASHNKETA